MSTAPHISIEPLETVEQFREAVALQKTIWGFEDIELLPIRLFVVASKIGGQIYGAYDDRRMIAFCLAIPGHKPGGTAYLHSHMLGVLPEYRDFGIGRRLKLRQRDDAIARGIELIEWTFDPLEIRNAHFNLERLGAVVRRFVRNQYGTTSSHLHGGLPTDRCTAEWWVNSPRVETILNREPYNRPATLQRIEVPLGISKLRREDPTQAKVIQAGIAAQFEAAFRKKLTAFAVDRAEDQATYLLGELL